MNDTTIILSNSLSELDKLHNFVAALGEKHHITDHILNSIHLALEEAIVNIIDYAYINSDTTDNILLTSSLTGRTLSFTIVDHGKPFDPTAVPDADTALQLKDRPIGGLGIFLIKNIMDTLSYRRIDDANILTMTITVP
jgi:anti-sigma regulatory factor (Ser/Thr protein kinase)